MIDIGVVYTSVQGLYRILRDGSSVARCTHKVEQRRELKWHYTRYIDCSIFVRGSSQRSVSSQQNRPAALPVHTVGAPRRLTNWAAVNLPTDDDADL